MTSTNINTNTEDSEIMKVQPLPEDSYLKNEDTTIYVDNQPINCNVQILDPAITNKINELVIVLNKLLDSNLVKGIVKLEIDPKYVKNNNISEEPGEVRESSDSL